MNIKKIIVNASLGGLTFGVDGDGNYGYYGADGSLVPFSSFKIQWIKKNVTIAAGNATLSGTFTDIPEVVLCFPNGNNMNAIWIYNNGSPIVYQIGGTLSVSNGYKTFTFSTSSSRPNNWYLCGILS